MPDVTQKVVTYDDKGAVVSSKDVVSTVSQESLNLKQLLTDLNAAIATLDTFAKASTTMTTAQQTAQLRSMAATFVKVLRVIVGRLEAV